MQAEKQSESKEANKPTVVSQPKIRKFRIIIEEQDNTDNNSDVPVRDPSPGGKLFLIQRGKEVDVPEGVKNNLDDCIITTYIRDKNGEEIEKKVRRFAMRVIGEVNEKGEFVK